MPIAYPSYRGTGARYVAVRDGLDSFPNLCLSGRHGMPRDQHPDPSRLTARVSAGKILAGRSDQANLREDKAEDAHPEAGAGTRDPEASDGSSA